MILGLLYKSKNNELFVLKPICKDNLVDLISKHYNTTYHNKSMESIIIDMVQ